MEEVTHRSSEVLLGAQRENSSPPSEEEEIRGETIGEDDERSPPSRDNGNDFTVVNASYCESGESKAIELGTLASVRLSESRSQNKDSSHSLSEVPVEYSRQTLLSIEELKDQVKAVHEKPLKIISGQPAQTPMQHPIRPYDGPSKLELSPICATQSGSSIPSPSSSERKVAPVENRRNPCLGDQDMDNSPKVKPVAALPMPKASSDGYNWRKYGQKQVKSPEGFRSYYRCTFSDCYAKKIDCCDRSNCVIETVYRSLHNHDPPQKLNCIREIKTARPIMPINGSDLTTHSVRCPSDPVPSTSSKETLPRIDQIPETKQQESTINSVRCPSDPDPSTSSKETLPRIDQIPETKQQESTINSVRCPSDPDPSTFSKETLLRIDQIPETKQQESSGSDETMKINFKDEHVDGPECANRQKRSSAAELGPLSKPGKKPKFVVHAVGDMGISGDGYRWRKYGQKMVKGNPHPRNYYRCTSAGCPVRKHIEKAVDYNSAVVITYKGVHDHDMPVPKKRHGSKSHLVDDTCDSIDSLKNMRMKPYRSETQLSMDKESDLSSESMNPGGEKTLETAQTLLSIEFEIKPS